MCTCAGDAAAADSAASGADVLAHATLKETAACCLETDNGCGLSRRLGTE